MISVKRRLGKFFSNSKVGALVLVNTTDFDPNFLYFTGFTSGLFEGNFLVVKKSGITLFTDTLEYGAAMSQKPKEMKVVLVRKRAELMRRMRREIKDLKVGVNYECLPVAYFNFLRNKAKIKGICDATRDLNATRMIKDPDEIRALSEGARMTKYAMAQIPKFAKEGMTEKHLAEIFTDLMMRRGAQAPSFRTIVSFGKNAAIPHHSPDDTRLKRNEIVLIDAGAKVRNYCSDITRTFIFKPDKHSAYYAKASRMIEIVRTAQRRAMALMKAGVVGKEAHLAAENEINTAENGIYKGRFIHSLSHSVGLNTHDGDVGLGPNTTMVLKAGMVLSCEPGIYVPGFGGVRIEDDVLVTKSGPKVL